MRVWYWAAASSSGSAGSGIVISTTALSVTKGEPVLPKPVRYRLFRLPGLSDLGVRYRRLLARSSTPMTYTPESTIVESGMTDLRIRMVLDGIVELRAGDRVAGQVGKGTLLGVSSSVGKNEPRGSEFTAVALTMVRTVVVAAPVLYVISQRSSSLAYWLERDSELAERVNQQRWA